MATNPATLAMPPIRRAILAACLLAGPVGCIPYAVGSTAQPLPPGEGRTAMTLYRIPRGLDVAGSDSTDRDNQPFAGMDLEMRRGIAEGIDVGLRVPSYSGVVATVKRRVAGGAGPEAGAVSIMPGLGLVNWLSHGMVELTVMGSAPRRHGITPYAGARLVQVVPLEPDAARDTPTAGGYVGVRLGGDEGGIVAELGVYHDESALGVRRGSTILVPSITLDGDVLDMLRRPQGPFGMLRWRR